MLFAVIFLGYYATEPSAGYTVFAADGSVLTARTTAGVVSLGGNAFQVDTGSPVNPSTIIWDDGLGTYSEPEAYNGAGGGGGGGDTIIVNDDLPCAT